jgi:hypothetical protein
VKLVLTVIVFTSVAVVPQRTGSELVLTLVLPLCAVVLMLITATVLADSDARAQRRQVHDP